MKSQLISIQVVEEAAVLLEEAVVVVLEVEVAVEVAVELEEVQKSFWNPTGILVSSLLRARNIFS